MHLLDIASALRKYPFEWTNPFILDNVPLFRSLAHTQFVSNITFIDCQRLNECFFLNFSLLGSFSRFQWQM